MESIINDNYDIILRTSNKLIHSYQFGLLPGRSCDTQLLIILDYITSHLDAGCSIDVIYLDFSKGFPPVAPLQTN